jgi:hypothetical protein
MNSSARLQQNNELETLTQIWYFSHRSSINSISLNGVSTRIGIKSLIYKLIHMYTNEQKSASTILTSNEKILLAINKIK